MLKLFKGNYDSKRDSKREVMADYIHMMQNANILLKRSEFKKIVCVVKYCLIPQTETMKQQTSVAITST